MEELQKTWEQKLFESKSHIQEQDKAKVEEDTKRKTVPHFWNLNEDSQLTNMVVHFVKRGSNCIGNKKASTPPDILMNGLSIQKEHAIVNNDRDKAITLYPCDGAKLLLNGEPLTGKVTLHHNDRYM